MLASAWARARDPHSGGQPPGAKTPILDKLTNTLRRRGRPAGIADIATVVSFFKDQLGLDFDEFRAQRSPAPTGCKGLQHRAQQVE